MSDDTSNGASLTAIRRAAARNRWAPRKEVSLHPAPIISKTTPKLPKPKAATPLQPGLTEMTKAAIAAYNDILGKPNGLLPSVSNVGFDTRAKEVKRVLETAKEICADLGTEFTPDFWSRYFCEVDKNDFWAGRGHYGNGHDNWTPDFESLTRRKTMLNVYERRQRAR